MQNEKAFSIQILLATLLLNTLLLLTLFVTLGGTVQAGGYTLSFFGIGLLFTVLLWFAIRRIGQRTLKSVPVPPSHAPSPASPRSHPAAKKDKPAPPPSAAAIQILSILQRKGRLIDFLQEDLSLYDDDQIGAAVRNVHEGCKQALSEYIALEPIFGETEGTEVTLAPGFDAEAVRLIGDVEGAPPFKGSLRHRGWRVARVDLPVLTQGREASMIVAAAEVEVAS